LYGVTGGVFLLAGTSVLLLGTGFLPAPIHDLIYDIGDANPSALHILQEFGSLMIFAGLITLWFTVYDPASRGFHCAITAFWALFALVHWVDIHGTFKADLGAVIQTIPVALFVALGLLRELAAGTAAPATA
jgi:hypothetical protein